VIPVLREKCPRLSIEIHVADGSVDLVANGYDAGIRLGEFVETDMVGVRLTRDFQWLVLATPSYLAHHGTPRWPRDLLRHECIQYRFPTAHSVYRWEFIEHGSVMAIDTAGPIVVDDHLTMLELCKQDLGLVYTADLVAAAELKSRALVPVLEGFVPPGEGLFLYYPASSRRQRKLRAFVEVTRQVLGHAPAAARRPASARRFRREH
jgi:DNA-binding transcriptional LysR family regulator